MKAQLTPTFPNYIQLRDHSRIPEWLWEISRLGSVIAAISLALILIISPDTGLFILWKLVIPVLPLTFLTLPGLWRNVCPLAAFNQTPRLCNFSRALTPPKWLKDYGFIIGMISFFVLASSRKWLFNKSGPASGLLLLGALLGAFIGGLLYKGKSGWCSSICPLYPVQRLYNQTPFKVIPNNYCTPCVGCTKNCYDFNPGTAYLADIHDPDRHYANSRKFFAAAMPGFILAFFTLPDVPAISPLALYAQMLLYMFISIALFTVADTFIKVSPNKLTAVWGAAAFSLFYWFVLPAWLTSVTGLLGLSLPVWIGWLGRADIIVLASVWIQRTYLKERHYIAEKGLPVAAPVAAPARAGQIAVTFQPGETAVSAALDESLLEIAEKNNQPIEAGCRMGMCGADPITVVEGMENLSPMGDEERCTLERLGLSKNARLACMCRVKGDVCVSLDAAQSDEPLAAAEPIVHDPEVQQVVIIGNGIAGVTAADTIRRHHPDCAIHLIGREKHPLYNRMAISRLIYGRSAMSGLYLQPDTWYEERAITNWLNTQVTQVDKDGRAVALATGETLPYDRLILACGSSSFVPDLPGFGMPGTFVLREADEAMEIRAFHQEHRCRRAVIAGGGLLGLEAGYALHKLGLHVTILERGPWLLRRQLDERGGYLLQKHLEKLGMQILLSAETDRLCGETRLQRVMLKDGSFMRADIFLMAAGIRPNTELAESLGLAVKRGVLVSDQMQTSETGIYAVGDVCEFDGEVPGLWAVATEQARVAAINAIGGAAAYKPVVPATTLKVVGVDVTSIGQVNAGPGEGEIVLEDSATQRYRKLVIANGRIVGAILLGYAKESTAVTAAIKQGWDVTAIMPALLTGDWDVLRELQAKPAVH
ncbi:MAG: FAD-dependent oxidoreductase [Ardenticatenaceae bacterium]|nr:FAD-dependent oxidoreductase [Ardenticatenaceae bacterium]MCB8988324.1 FAD-dependent oxidoreductase [Ardenticatenaceae bacterium]